MNEPLDRLQMTLPVENSALSRRNLYIIVSVLFIWMATAGGVKTARALQPGDPLAGDVAFSLDAYESPQRLEEAATPTDRDSFWDILRAAGLVGVLIVLLSLAAVALVIEHLMSIRASTLVPPDLGPKVHDLLAAGRYGEAAALCREDPSFLAEVIESGIIELDGGWTAVEKGVEDAMAEQSARLLRKIEYLSVIGNIAPMLGLLGTVIGMVMAFRELNISQGAAQASDLAGGIYQALITTVLGLVVAIPSLAAHAVFRNRVDHLVAEVAFVARHALGPIKRTFPRGATAPVVAVAPRSSPPPPPPTGRAE